MFPNDPCIGGFISFDMAKHALFLANKVALGFRLAMLDHVNVMLKIESREYRALFVMAFAACLFRRNDQAFPRTVLLVQFSVARKRPSHCVSVLATRPVAHLALYALQCGLHVP